MLPLSIHWVNAILPSRLALMPRPRGGEDLASEIEALRGAGVDTVVSLLEASEVRELELRSEGTLCSRYGIKFYSHPIPDRGTPLSKRETTALLQQLHTELKEGRVVAIHCRAGIGRTGLIAGCLLRLVGVPEHEVFNVLSKARGVQVPDTTEQVEWVHAFVR
jgi:protein-tyrosine phosphatase